MNTSVSSSCYYQTYDIVITMKIKRVQCCPFLVTMIRFLPLLRHHYTPNNDLIDVDLMFDDNDLYLITNFK